MKIISKYKDFYDYLNGKYGIDEKCVLDRRDSILKLPFVNDEVIQIYICGYLFEGLYLYKKEKFYWGKQLEQFHEEGNNIWDKKSDCYRIVLNNYYNNTSSYYQILKDNKIDKHEVNKNLNCPILIKHHSGNCRFDDISYYKFPILKDYNIQSMLSPEDIYLMLTNWLIATVDLPDNRTNKERILSAGFDNKTSFRKM